MTKAELKKEVKIEKKKKGIFGIRKKTKKKKKKEEVKEPVIYLPLKEEYEIVEEYWIKEPYARVVIATIPELGYQKTYFVQEEKLTPDERKAVDKLIDILSVELQPPETFEVDVRKHVLEEARRLIQKYRKAIRGLTEESWEKVVYYVERDLLGYGPIDVLMSDWNLEDISCDGVNRAIHVWHRKYESIPTNVIIVDREYLREFIVKLAHMGGKHVSAAFPIVDAMLPGRHRLAATFGEEVSPRGSTFTIRKFRERPFSIIDLIKSNNLDTWTASYMWLLLENHMTFMIIGATAAGKTTLLNALTSFFKPGFKVVTIEETPELNLPHENWVQLVSRESYGLGETKSGEITLYDLVRLSLRYRPDYIIVGEVRGEEAFVLFQAMATGHGGLSTMHADSLERAIKRLTSPPMNVAPSYIPSLNLVMLTERTILPGGGFGRRVRYVWEVEDYEKYRLIMKWNPTKDYHEVIGDSYLLGLISERLGKSTEELIKEIERRQVVLIWMLKKGITEIHDVARVINEYYNFPDDTYHKALKELAAMGVDIKKEIKRIRYRPPVIQQISVPSSSSSVSLKEAPKITSQSKVKAPIASIINKAVKAKEFNLTPDKEAILKSLYLLGGEADHTTLLSESGLSRSSFWRIVQELVRDGLIASSLLYIEHKPVMGFKLTELGKNIVKELG